MERRRDPRAGDAAYPVYLRFGGGHGHVGDTVVSRSAMRLHVYAVLASLEAGRPGFIGDDYLDAVAVDTSVDALELCTAGLWTREAAGYRVLEGEVMRMAREMHRQLEELSMHCRMSGGHEPDLDHPGACRKCGVQLG